MPTSGFLSLILWSVVPNWTTSILQSIYYSITISAGDPKPQPNSPRYQEHRRRIHVLVVTVYLFYTLCEADYELQRASHYYAELGVPFAATERDIKSRFRRLAALHHPDKAAPGQDASGDLFMQLKTAADTLTEPARRFAYERFGPDVVAWQHCASVRDYVSKGCQLLVPYYGAAAGVMYVLGLLGYLEWGRYWRWITLVSLCGFELYVVTRPRFPWLVSEVVNPLLVRFTKHAPYLPFQMIALARKCSITIYIAFSQLGPLLQPKGQQGMKPGDVSEKALRQQLDRLEQLSRAMDADVTQQFEVEMAPFARDPDMLARIRSKLKEWLVQNTIRGDPMVRDALGRSIKKRRPDAPIGARGNR